MTADNSPSDDFGETPPDDEPSVGERFLLKACDLWDVPDATFTWQRRAEIREISRWLCDRISIEKRIGGSPALFQEYWRDVLGRTATIRPQYIPEHWAGYDRWLIQNHETHRASNAA